MKLDANNYVIFLFEVSLKFYKTYKHLRLVKVFEQNSFHRVIQCLNQFFRTYLY